LLTSTADGAVLVAVAAGVLVEDRTQAVRGALGGDEVRACCREGRRVGSRERVPEQCPDLRRGGVVLFTHTADAADCQRRPEARQAHPSDLSFHHGPPLWVATWWWRHGEVERAAGGRQKKFRT